MSTRVMAIFMVLFISGVVMASDAMSKLNNYLVYYGEWDENKIRQALEFDLIILHPGRTDTNIDAKLVRRLKNGKDNLPGTSDDIKVLAYVSIGESENIERGPRELKNGFRGPAHKDASGKMVPSNNGFRDWYLDEIKLLFTADSNKVWGDDGLPKTTKGHDKIPDENGKWHSYFVDVSNIEWQAALRKRMELYVNTFKCDGLFLDTVDSASPWGNYGYMQKEMVDLLVKIREWFPQIILVMNRGLFLFEKYGQTLNENIDGVMFESYISEWDWYNKIGFPHRWFEGNQLIVYNWLKPLNLQENGITILFLHYFNPIQPEAPLFNYSLSQTAGLKALHYVTEPSLGVINPPYRIIKQNSVPLESLPAASDLKISLNGWQDHEGRKHLWFSLKKVGQPFLSTPFLWPLQPGFRLDLSNFEPGTYDLQIAQVDSMGKLLRQGAATAKIPAKNRLAKVQGLEIEVREGALKLKWNSVADANKYFISWGKSRFLLNDEMIIRRQTEYVFSHLENNQMYYFKVAAMSGTQIGYPSELYFAAPTITKPPPTPKLVSIKVVDKCVDIRWQPSSDVVGYLIYIDPTELTQGLPLQIPLGETHRCVPVPKTGKYIVRLAGYDAYRDCRQMTKFD